MSPRPSSTWQASCAATLTLTLAFGLASPMHTSALAADLGVAPIYRPFAPVANWTGSYFGISGGGAWGNSVVHNDFIGADQTPHFDLHGGLVGATAGFNVQNRNLVYGFEGDASVTGKRGSTFDFPPAAGFSTEVKEPWLSTFRGRVGYAQSNWMVYATAGGALANVQNNMVGPPGAASDQHWHWGWTVGGGIEMKLTHDWSAKVEYLYVGLQDKSYFTPAPGAFPSNQRTTLDDQIVRVGVNYKLPWGILDSFYKPGR